MVYLKNIKWYYSPYLIVSPIEESISTETIDSFCVITLLIFIYSIIMLNVKINNLLKKITDKFAKTI